MKVKELIEELKKFEGELEVEYYSKGKENPLNNVNLYDKIRYKNYEGEAINAYDMEARKYIQKTVMIK